MIAAVATRNIATITLAQPLATLVLSAPNATAVGTKFQNSLEVRVVTTIISFLAFILTGVTYWMLVKYSAPLSSQCAIPSKILGENLRTVLEFAWPGSAAERENRRHLPLTLLAEKGDSVLRLYVKRDLLDWLRWEKREIYTDEWFEEWWWGMGIPTFKHGTRKLRGYSETPFTRSDLYADLSSPSVPSTSLSLPTASPVLKSIIQASVWEWVGVWLVFFVTINTLFLNGFATNDKTPDMWLRLALVLIYGIAVIVHTYHVCLRIYQILTFIIFQATWVIIISNFAFGVEKPDDLGPRQTLRNIPKPLLSDDGSSPHLVFHTFQGILLGEISVKRMVWDIFPASPCNVKSVPMLNHTDDGGFVAPRRASEDLGYPSASEDSGALFFREFGSVENAFTNQLKPLMNLESKDFEKAAELSLERIMANIAILLGICLATGLASLTNVQSVDATSAQLGSYALLLSVTSGLLALVSSTSHINTAARSAKALLSLQEHVLSTSWKDHLGGGKNWKQQELPQFGLYKSKAKHFRGVGVTIKGLWQSLTPSQRWQSVFFGSTLSFLPMAGDTASEVWVDSQQAVEIPFHSESICIGLVSIAYLEALRHVPESAQAKGDDG